MSEFPSHSPVDLGKSTTTTTTTTTTNSKPKPFDCPLLIWSDPVKTGKVFVSLIFSLILVKYVNLLSLFFRTATYALLASAVAEFFGKFVTGKGFVARFRPEKLSNEVSTKILKYFEIISKILPDIEIELQKIVYAEDVEKTFKVCGLTYILFKITGFFNLYRLLFGSTILAFTIPYVYDRYHEEATELIQEFLKEASIKTKEQIKIVQEKSTPYLEKAQSKLGPVSQFIQSKYQTRTAGSTVDTTSNNVSQKDEINPSFGSTSGVQIQQYEVIEPLDSTSEFPSVPETTPLSSSFSPSVHEVEKKVPELNNNVAN